MVIEDWNSSSVAPQAKKNSNVVDADPFDRFAAHILDFGIVLIPVSTLMLAPINRKMSDLYLKSDWTEFTLEIGFAILLFAFLFCCYHGVATFLFGRTLGKKLLQLEVRDLWSDERPTLWSSFVRSFLVLSQVITLGLTFLFVMVNRKHRGLHDQLLDTKVVSYSRKPKVNYRAWPVQILLRGSFALAAIVIVPTCLSFGMSLLKSLDLEKIFASVSSKEQEDCAEIKTLEEGMSLVATGAEPIRCLRDLAEAEFYEGASPSALAYLVKSFLHVDQAELSDKYLDQVCRTESASPACLLSQVISAWSSGNLDEIETVLEDANGMEEPYLDLWALRYFQQSGYFDKSLRLTARLENYPYLKMFAQSERAKAQYLLGEISDSEDLVRKLRSESPSSPVTEDLVAWSCQRRIDAGCTNRTHEFCSDLQSFPVVEYLNSPQILLGQLRIKECANEDVPLDKYISEAQPSYWHEFMYGLKKYKKGDFKSAWSIWKGVVNNGDTPDFIKANTIQRMITHPEISELDTMTDLVSQIESYEYRKSTVERVTTAFRNLNLAGMADAMEREFKAPIPSENKRLPASVGRGSR